MRAGVGTHKSMFEKVRDYVLQSGLPAYREFFEALRRNRFGESEALRAGVAAAAVLYHLREHLPEPIRPKVQALTQACPDYALVRDVANASKHHKLTHSPYLISHANQIYEIAVSTLYKDKKGVYPVGQVAVHVKLDDGTQRDLAEILHNVMDMWCQQLVNLGVVEIDNPETLPDDHHVSRAEAAKRKKITTVILRGEERNHRYSFTRFNYQSGKSEPVDLTGAKVTWRAWKRIKSVPMHVELQVRGQRMGADLNIPLTRAQESKYIELSSDGEKARFLRELVGRSRTLQLSVQEALQRVISETGWTPTGKDETK